MNTLPLFSTFRGLSLLFLVSACGFAQSKPGAATPSAAPTVVLADDFTAAGKWAIASGDVLQTRSKNGALQIGNGVIQAALAKPVQAFTLKIKLRHTEWQRCLVIWITDSTGGQGYGLIWDSSIEGQFNGEGLVVLQRLNKDGPPLFNTRGAPVCEVTASGHPALSDKFAEITLKRFANGSFFLEVDGAAILTSRDTTWTTFENIYLGGNGASLVGPVHVTEGAVP